VGVVVMKKGGGKQAFFALVPRVCAVEKEASPPSIPMATTCFDLLR
jgi:hypothetical protein